MTGNYAAWVAPHAATFASTREEAAGLVRRLDDAQLARPTGNEGWTVREELAHIAGSDEDFVRTLGALLRGEPVDLSVFGDIDARNARNLAARAGRSGAEIAGELEASAQAIAGLMGQLTDEDEKRQPEGVPFPLGQMMMGYAMHDGYHLGQIRAALGAKEPA